MFDENKLKELRETQFTQIIIEWFRNEIDKMSDISTHKSWDEVLGKQYASGILNKMISRLEKKEESIKNKNQYR